jgi:hypothetical protein
MTDREKVIKWLEECQKPECTCKNCPYYLEVDASAADEAVLEHCCDQLMRDALALLREQEPVKPKREVNENGQILSCGNCGAWFAVQKQKFCHECGMAVKWND